MLQLTPPPGKFAPQQIRSTWFADELLGFYLNHNWNAVGDELDVLSENLDFTYVALGYKQVAK